MINLKVLYLESNDNDAAHVEALLTRAIPLLHLNRCTDNTDYRDQLKTYKPDVVVSAWQTRDTHYTLALQSLRTQNPDCPFILIVQPDMEQAAINALQHGVDDYLLADRLLRLPAAIIAAVKHKAFALQANSVTQNEKRLLAMIENSGEIVSVAGLDGQIIYTSGNTKQVLGYTKSDFIKVRFDPGFMHPDDKEAQLALYQLTRETPGVVHPFTWRIRHAEGHWVWIAGKVTNLLHVPAIKGIVANFKDVSEQREAELQLAQSEQRYRHIVETAQEGIWMLDSKNITLFINKKMADMLGYQVEEILGRPNYDFKPLAEKQATIDRVQHRSGDEIEMHESAFITKAGKTLICRVSTNGIFGPDGSHLGTLAMITDITELKRQQEALQKSQANLSAIIENTNDLVYSLDTNLSFITFNNRFKQAIKTVYDFEVEQGGNAMQLINNLDEKISNEWKTIYKRALAGETQQFVNDYATPDGTVYLSYSVNPISDGDKVIGLSVFSRDITRRRAHELALIQSEANLRSVFENTDLAIILYDLDLVTVSFNTKAANQNRRANGQELTVGISAYQYFPEERWPVIKAAYSSVMQGEAVNYEVAYQMINGQEWFEARWVGVTDAQEKIVGIILTMKHITAQKLAEIEREKMTADILRRNRHLEQFTYIISHNVRAPVANIKGLAELLTTAGLHEAPTEQIVTALSASAEQLDKVIIDLNQILQVDKQMQENKQRVPLQKLVEQIKLELHAEFIKYNVSVTMDFNTARELFTVKSYIYSIFHNLITNSIKYRREDTDPAIAIRSSISGDKVMILFEDNGRGIDLARYGNDLFGLYKRFDFSVEGKGMGLFMVKQQIQSLGGDISVSSQPGIGTTFKLELPL